MDFLTTIFLSTSKILEINLLTSERLGILDLHVFIKTYINVEIKLIN
ncbi:hypothetical protein CLOSAC_13750 [Clostridium saccharobutylicum]|uniref:Uncharacterized protein n=1 Tax=Clostridium saccharobutylicum TaxID=169679 RepID=A0A1S8NDD8_CLOSA|nr:hypothetical protein CLOSAC_13750 [Clostridium saccharobutylicum]